VGAAGGMVFEHPKSWDAKDRFEWVAKTASDIQATALRKLLARGGAIALFNPLNGTVMIPSRFRSRVVPRRLLSAAPCRADIEKYVEVR